MNRYIRFIDRVINQVPKQTLLFFCILGSFSCTIDAQKFDLLIDIENHWHSSVFNTDQRPFARSSKINLNMGLSIGFTLNRKYRLALGRRNHLWFTNIIEDLDNSGSAVQFSSLYYDINVSRRIQYKSLLILPQLGVVYRDMDRVLFFASQAGLFLDRRYVTFNSKNLGVKTGILIGWAMPYNFQLIGSLNYLILKETPSTILSYHFGVGFRF